jgi:hypothetical protein
MVLMSRSLAAAGVVVSMVVSGLTLGTACGTAQAADALDVRVDLQAADGAGCPSAATVTASPQGRDGFVVRYNAFRVSGGDFKNCQVVVRVNVPAGLTYALDRVNNEGSALLDPGATGMLQVTSYFAGLPETAKQTTMIDSPRYGAWQTTSAVDPPQWAPCDTTRFLNINNVASVRGPSSNFLEVTATTVVHLRLRSC